MMVSQTGNCRARLRLIPSRFNGLADKGLKARLKGFFAPQETVFGLIGRYRSSYLHSPGLYIQ
jgi:hypothetical protein